MNDDTKKVDELPPVEPVSEINLIAIGLDRLLREVRALKEEITYGQWTDKEV